MVVQYLVVNTVTLHLNGWWFESHLRSVCIWSSHVPLDQSFQIIYIIASVRLEQICWICVFVGACSLWWLGTLSVQDVFYLVLSAYGAPGPLRPCTGVSSNGFIVAWIKHPSFKMYAHLWCVLPQFYECMTCQKMMDLSFCVFAKIFVWSD